MLALWIRKRSQDSFVNYLGAFHVVFLDKECVTYVHQLHHTHVDEQPIDNLC